MWCPDDSWCEALPFLGEALTVEASKVNVSAPVFSLRNTLWIQWIDKWNAWCWNQLERSHRDLTIFFATCLFSGRCEHCWIDRIGCYLRWFEIGFEVTDSVQLAFTCDQDRSETVNTCFSKSGWSHGQCTAAENPESHANHILRTPTSPDILVVRRSPPETMAKMSSNHSALKRLQRSQHVWKFS